MLGLLNTVLSKGNTLLTYVKDGLVMANRFLTPPKLTFPVDASAEFNGTSDYIQLSEPFSHTNHTIAAWVYVTNTSAEKFIFGARDTSNDGIAIWTPNDETIRYKINDVFLTSTTSVAGQWAYITATYDGTTQRLYIDGSQETSQATSKTISTTTDATIGKNNLGTDYYNGNLANLAIWNRALSSDEINSVMWKSYEGLTGAESNGLKAWYSLDDITSPAASLANMEQLATDKDLNIENKAAITAAVNALS